MIAGPHFPVNRTYWCAYGPGATHTGVTEPNQVTDTGQPNMISDADSSVFAGMVEAELLVPTLPLLPVEGEECFLGAVYNWGGVAAVCIGTHTRTDQPPSSTPALFALALP